MSFASGIAAVISDVIAKLDPTQNPYPAFEAVLRSSFYPTPSRSFQIQCYVLVGIFAT